jgi:hypothetical protein
VIQLQLILLTFLSCEYEAAMGGKIRCEQCHEKLNITWTLVILPDTTLGTTTSESTDFSSLTLTTVVIAGAGGVIFGVGNKPNVNEDCPPEGASTRDVVRLL